jgi:hypothetical protein
MTITLTREEAQQVLKGLMSGGPGANRKPIVDMIRARLSQPEPEPVTDKYLMEVECTKCGAKQDGVLTVTVPPQPEPEPVAWEPKVERLYSPEGLLLWERVKYTPDGEWQSLREKNA